MKKKIKRMHQSDKLHTARDEKKRERNAEILDKWFFPLFLFPLCKFLVFVLCFVYPPLK